MWCWSKCVPGLTIFSCKYSIMFNVKMWYITKRMYHIIYIELLNSIEF